MKAVEACGALLVGGFQGKSLTKTFRKALERGTRAGAILFARNIGSMREVCELNGDLLRAGAKLIAVDQEGGRVARLKSPLTTVPPALSLSSMDPAAIEELAYTQSRELLALGFNLNFAPVLDIHSRSDNPIIGDRSFGTTPQDASRRALVYAGGMRKAGILACGKHFPGHGDTVADSHLELPTVASSREALLACELVPFQKAARFGIDSMMSAHVLYPALDSDHPATLSHTVCTTLLRDELHYEGVLFSDDLEMKALSLETGENAVRAILAGCDALLICSDEMRQEDALRAMTHEYEKSEVFRSRCLSAKGRLDRMSVRRQPAPNFGLFEELVAKKNLS